MTIKKAESNNTSTVISIGAVASIKLLLHVAAVLLLSVIAGKGTIFSSARAQQLINSNFSSDYNSMTKWDCNRPWPSLTLLLPVNTSPPSPDKRARKASEWKRIFLRSLILFWPLDKSNTKLTLLADAETKGSAAFIATAKVVAALNSSKQIPGGCQLLTNEPSPYYRGVGWIRQMYLEFYADNFTDSEYIGFVDTDTLFVTVVDREDFFEQQPGNRPMLVPVVNGLRVPYTLPKSANPIYMERENTTRRVLGLDQPMNFMAYFPVIIKREHLSKMRTYVEKRWGMPFYQVFATVMATSEFGQFDMILTYCFHFHRDEYRWYVHEALPGWDGVNPPASYGQLANRSVFDASYMFDPKPRVAVHASYRFQRASVGRPTPNEATNLNFLLVRGICNHMINSLPTNNETRLFYECTKKEVAPGQHGYYDEMHAFESFDWNNIVSRDKLIKMQNQRNERMRHCPTHEWGSRYNVSHWFLFEGDMVLCQQCPEYYTDYLWAKFFVYNHTLHIVESDDTVLAWERNYSSWNYIKRAPWAQLSLFRMGEMLRADHPIVQWHPDHYRPSNTNNQWLETEHR